VLLVLPVKVAVDLVDVFCWDDFLLSSFSLLVSLSFLRRSSISSSELACWSFRFSKAGFHAREICRVLGIFHFLCVPPERPSVLPVRR
jgi:hypothetical protein